MNNTTETRKPRTEIEKKPEQKDVQPIKLHFTSLPFRASI